MDDICDSVPTVESAQQLTNDLDEILDNGGFKVRGWSSNETLDENLQKEASSSVNLNGESGKKVLGTVWNNAKDTFTFKVKANEFQYQQKKILAS